MSEPIVVREDLSQRRGLSKSAVTRFDMCGQKAWQAKHYPRPFIPKPKVTFGSCVDAAVEILITCARAGIPLDFDRAIQASLEVQDRDGVEVDQDEAEQAIRRYAEDILPTRDFTLCRTQAHVRVPLEDWGEVDGHPDLILATNEVDDVKTAARPKQTAITVELGLYGLMVEEETGRPVPTVGYHCWVRSKKPYWQDITAPFDDEFRRWTRERVGAYVRADRADDVLNAARAKRGLEPENYSFPSFALNASICLDCEFNPLFGGACRMAPAHLEEGTDAA